MSMAAGRARMSGHYIRKRLATARPARRLALFSGLFLVVSILSYRLGAVDFPALKLLMAATVGMASAALLLALGGLARVWRSGLEGGGAALSAMAVALLVLSPFALAAVVADLYPRGATAETDGMLAADIGGGASLDEALSAEPATDDPAAGLAESPLTSRRFPAPAAQVYTVARLALAEEGWTLLAVDGATPQVEGAGPQVGGASGLGADLGISGTVDIPLPTARSSIDMAAAADPFDRPEASDYTLKAEALGPILALPSDVTIRIVEDGAETFVDLRATSRSVAWDLGQNRRFIEDFLARLDEAMTGVAVVLPPATDG